jgi:RNA polymerase sigma-70 factor (ECF subfamily)
VQDPELTALIAAAQRGDAQALHGLVDRYSSRLFGFLFRLCGRRNEAEDLMQEVFVRIVRTIERYRDDGRFEAWLFRIAANLVRDSIRRRRRRPTQIGPDANDDDDPLDRAADSAGPPEAALETAEEVARLNAALQRLPDAEREVIMLRHFSDLSFKEVADIMGTPIGTALARSHRALRRLKELMEAGEGRHPGVAWPNREKDEHEAVDATT